MHICIHIVIRIDRVKEKIRKPAYDGHFPIVKSNKKYYTVKINGKDMNIYISRIKPAYLLMADVNIHDHELPDKSLSVYDNKLPLQPSTKNE